MEVANFYSALTNPSRLASSQWLTSGASKDFVLLLPDGTTLNVDIQVKDSSGLKSNDFVQVKVYLNHRLIENGKTSNGDTAASDGRDNHSRTIASLLDPSHFPLTIQCQPPKPKYTTAEEEPDDNSSAMRASRYASAHFDLTRFLSVQNLSASTPKQILATIWIQLYVIMSVLPTEEAFNIVLGEQIAAPAANMLIEAGLAVKHPLQEQEPKPTASMVLCTRAAFWQTTYPFQQSPWLLPESYDASPKGSGLPSRPTTYIFSNNSYHPKRPTKPTKTDGPLYKRYIVELGQTLTFEVASSSDEVTVKKYAEWQNSDRVNSGWRQRDTQDEHQKYLQRVEQSDSSLGLIGKWDGQPFGYFEVYWVKESNIGPYYKCDDYDCGYHALIGEEKFRGPHRVRSWMGSLIHMMFLLECRTQNVVLEPRASNHKMINYAQMCGGHVEKLIDLPHKRAALVICPREGFFQLCPLGPLPVQ